MSDESSNAIRETRRDWMVEHREMYLRSGGTQGHIMDITPVGGPVLGLHCMIRFKGRKSGKIFITPLCYLAVAGEVMICGSKGGSDQPPAWYLNIQGQPEMEFQIATQAYRAAWREAEGEERERLWRQMVDYYPFYANYQASTARRLPLVLMKPIGDLPVFREEDATGMRDY